MKKCCFKIKAFGIFLTAVFFIITHLNINAQQKLVSIKTTEQLIASLKPNTTLFIDTSLLLLHKLEQSKGQYYEVREDKESGNYLEIKNIDGLRITGRSNIQTDIISNNLDQAVLQFSNCNDVEITNLHLAHGIGKGKMCTSASLLLSQCKNFNIENCKLSGSGLYGIMATRFANTSKDGYGVRGLQVKNTEISGCTEGIVDVEFSENIEFLFCVFIDNIGGFTFSNIENLKFNNCRIALNVKKENNSGFQEKITPQIALFQFNKVINANFSNNLVHSNKFDVFYNKLPEQVKLENNHGINNTFTIKNKQ